MKAIILAACVAAIGAAAYFVTMDRVDRANITKAEAEVAEDEQNHRNDRMVRECKEAVRLWENGPHAPLIEKYGQNAAKAVENCRGIIAISDLE